ncbi:MAG: hypothetical protein LBC63_04660 [Holophagales bacterium]|jgi:uncharacterized protein YbaR (Trm112 family)|nr:hypothetical protein [Holophagales bacterium]
MPIDPELLSILCCPAEREGEPCHGDLTDLGDWLQCSLCFSNYLIENGIPVLLAERAVASESVSTYPPDPRGRQK